MSNPPADKRYLVYLASNASGLDVERYEVQRLMARHGMVNVGLACREDAGPYDWNLVRSQIESADLFILLLGDDYGPMAPTGISFLHREFVHAKSLNKPTLAFIKNSLPSLWQWPTNQYTGVFAAADAVARHPGEWRHCRWPPGLCG